MGDFRKVNYFFKSSNGSKYWCWQILRLPWNQTCFILATVIPFSPRWHHCCWSETFQRNQQYACLSVRLSVFLCTCCWAQWHSADIMATRLRDCCGIFTKDVNFFFFSMHLNQRRLFFFLNKKVIGAKIVQYFTVLPCLSFVRSLADVFLFELDQSGLDLGCSHHYSQYSGTRWMYCCKYIVTHSYAVTVDSLHMYY